MRAIFYLARKTIKNLILDLIYHPGKLIVYLLLAATIIFSIFAPGNPELGGVPSEAKDYFANIGILHGVYIVILFLIGLPVILSGLSSGTTLFSMSDVNFLFISPISPKTNLLYGITKKMGATFLMFFIFLIYGNMAVDIFNVSTTEGVILVLGIVVFILTSQLLTLVFYSITNGKPKAINILKGIIYGCLVVTLFIVTYSIYVNGLNFNSVMNALKSPYIEYVPFFGWMKGIVFGILNKNIFNIVVFGTLFTALVVASIIIFVKYNPDYYEDVLQNTESTYEMRQAMKQGKMTQKQDLTFGKVKVKNTGINSGYGANTFFFKHLREIKRRSKLLFINVNTVILATSVFVTGFLMNMEAGDKSLNKEIIAFSMILLGVYMQFFFTSVGEWNRELLKPYIYLVPEPPLKKLIYASATSVIKPFFDAILIYGILGIYLKLNIIQILICVLSYGSFGIIYNSVNIFVERFIGGINNKMITIMIYMTLLFICTLPGTIGTIIVGVIMANFNLVMFIPMILWNFIAGAIIYYINKETLHNMEINI